MLSAAPSKRKVRPVRIVGDIAYVPLSQGYEAIIDAADVPLVEAWNWYAAIDRKPDGGIRAVYAARKEKADGIQRVVYMHRVVLSAPSEMLVDHFDGNGLNNRRRGDGGNVRLATSTQNRCNVGLGASNTSGAKCVVFDKRRKKWQAAIQVNGKRRYLGAFDDLAEAAQRVAAERNSLHGDFGRAL